MRNLYMVSISSGKAPTPSGKRPYLRAEERRRQLLAAASRRFDDLGFGGVTMAGVAAGAGVSRQLVYDHFADLDGLLEAFVAERLDRYRRTRPDVADLPPERAATAMFDHVVAMPPTDRRVIRLLVADVGLRNLDPLRDRFLADERARWPGLPSSGAGAAIVWTATSALLALADAVAAGDLDLPAAADLAVAVVSALSDRRR
jgi:AcrR family transcriptional regulator